MCMSRLKAAGMILFYMLAFGALLVLLTLQNGCTTYEAVYRDETTEVIIRETTMWGESVLKGNAMATIKSPTEEWLLRLGTEATVDASKDLDLLKALLGLALKGVAK